MQIQSMLNDSRCLLLLEMKTFIQIFCLKMKGEDCDRYLDLDLNQILDRDLDHHLKKDRRSRSRS